MVKQAIRFAVVGVLTAALYYALLYVAVESLGVAATLASSVVYVIVVGLNYLMHHGWTFAESGPHTNTLPRYLVMVFCGFLINGTVMYVGVSHLAMNYLLIQTLAIAMVVIWNFSVAHFWVFRT